MPTEINLTPGVPAAPERIEAVKVLGERLLDTVKDANSIVGLDALISAYVSAAIRLSPISLLNAVRGMATVRLVLLRALQGADRELSGTEQVRQLADHVLLPDLAQHDHAVALSALLSVYRELLARHPCCAESHAVQLFALWQQASAAAAAADSPKPTTH